MLLNLFGKESSTKKRMIHTTLNKKKRKINGSESEKASQRFKCFGRQEKKKKNIGKETIKENLLKKGNVQVFDKKIH
jgi:hypothetical protein